MAKSGILSCGARGYRNEMSVFLALGANLPSRVGTPAQTLVAALVELERRGLIILRSSHPYASPAWPNPSDPMFVNAVVEVKANSSPADILALVHATETAFGRTRSVPNSPRTLDIDILDFESRVEAGPPILPHPRMHERAFVLLPLKEIARRWRHPRSQKSVDALLEALPAAQRNAVVSIQTVVRYLPHDESGGVESDQARR